MLKIVLILLIISLIFMSCTTTTCTIHQYICHDMNTPFHESDWKVELSTLRHQQGIRIQKKYDKSFYCKFRKFDKMKQEEYNLLYHFYCDSSSLKLPKYMDTIEIELISGKKIQSNFQSFDLGVINAITFDDGNLFKVYTDEIEAIRSDYGYEYNWPGIYFRLRNNSIPIKTTIIIEKGTRIVTIQIHEIEKIYIKDKNKFKLNVYLFLLSLLVDVVGMYALVVFTRGMSGMN
ncbi:hypothetical protein KAR48_11075 [bacterium]|nr:hypothetical protein [bacterium]